jgi:hypothetical protein
LEEDKKKLEEEKNRALTEVEKLSDNQRHLEEEVIKIDADKC